MKKKDTQKKQDLLILMRKRFKLMLDADKINRQNALDDMKFINVPNDVSNRGASGSGQWDLNMAKERGNRPMYVFNKLRITMKRIINDIRSQRPSGKVRGVEGGDPKVAEIFEGLIRNIWNISDGDTVIDGATEYMVSAGYGAWRIVTDYSTNTAFEQDIRLEEIQNPMCLFCDPSAKDMMKKTAVDWILTDKISRDEYKKNWPKAEIISFEDHEFDDNETWGTTEEDEVRIAEYWYKEPIEKEIWQLQDGKVIEADTDEANAILATPEQIKDKRIVQTDRIMMFIASGESILEGPIEWAGSMFPFVVVYGEYMLVDGTIYWYGAGRWAKDAQRSYTVSRTAITETIAQAPQAKGWATTKQAEGNVDKWAEAHLKNFPFLLYNADPQATGAPQRMGGPEIPAALIAESQIASEEINMVTGRYQSDVGAPNPAKSGKQEMVRNMQGEIATYNYPDNMGKAIGRTWELLIDLIPQIYDTERELRILGTDGAEDYKKINTFAPDSETGEPIKINDLSVGQYDTVITVGPSFSTRRQEAAETYQQLMQGNPEIFPVIGDLVFKSMDLPYAEEISERLQVMLPPQIQQMINEDQDIPPEVQAMMGQAQQAMQMVEAQMQEVQKAAQETEIDKSEVEKLMANLKTEVARFEARIAKELARIAEKESHLTLQTINHDHDAVIKDGQEQVAGDRQMFNVALAEEMHRAIENIQGMAAEFNEFAVQTLAQIQQEKDDRPKIVRVDAVREKGKLSAVPVYEE